MPPTLLDLPNETLDHVFVFLTYMIHSFTPALRWADFLVFDIIFKNDLHGWQSRALPGRRAVRVWRPQTGEAPFLWLGCGLLLVFGPFDEKPLLR